MLRHAIDFTCSSAQENLVNRGVDSLFDSLSWKDNLDSDSENMERNFIFLMARAEDLEKEINIKLEQGCKERKREIEVWFDKVKEVEREYLTFVDEEERKGVMKKIFGGDDKAIKLNARICYLDKRSRLFGELVFDDDSTCRRLPRPTTVLEGAKFQDNLEKIQNLLENDRVSSIGVHGIAGVGKSALIEHVHNQLLERNKCVLWIAISSQRCSINMLQDKIARKLRLDLSGEDDDDEGARAGILNHALSKRENFVLILDGVWERIDLRKVGVPLSMEGCKWIMTSRSLKVCREMKCQEMIFVEPLSINEGWNLFVKNLDQISISSLGDSEVEEIGKRMVGICDGLPLLINTVAGVVSGLTEIKEWRNELKMLEFAMGYERKEDNIFRVLKYKFDRKKNKYRCLGYCSGIALSILIILL